MATTSRTTPKSKPKAHFSVSQAEKEVNDGEIVEPFTVELRNGDVVTLRGLDEVGWQVAASFTPEEPFLFFRAIVQEDDWKDFVGEDFPVAVMRKLQAAWREHYGMPPLGE